MSVLWKYLKPQRVLIVVALILAGISQLLSLVDPLIFGKIIDDYALNPSNSTEEALVKGVLFWLGVAISVAVLAQVTKAFQDYFTRLAVKKFGMQIFNDGLQQTLRLSYDEFEEQRSGETLSVLQKVREDTQVFINSFINVVFSSVVGICFLITYSVTKNLLLIPVFIYWYRRAGFAHRTVKQADQDDAAVDQPRNLQNIGGDYRIPPEYRAGKKSWPDLPGNTEIAGTEPEDFQPGDDEGKKDPPADVPAGSDA